LTQAIVVPERETTLSTADVDNRQGWPNVQHVYPGCFGSTKKVEDSGDLAIQIRCFTIVDTRAPAIAIYLLGFADIEGRNF
jgi:hypothetical protein